MDRDVEMIEVDESNIDKYTLEDVIFPILGHKVKMPKNADMRKILEDLMKKDNMRTMICTMVLLCITPQREDAASKFSNNRRS